MDILELCCVIMVCAATAVVVVFAVGLILYLIVGMVGVFFEKKTKQEKEKFVHAPTESAVYISQIRDTAIKETLQQCLTYCEEQDGICHDSDLEDIAKQYGVDLYENDEGDEDTSD
ncbi:MAG: hypothetical protein K2N84_05930 [Clostridia bacterium]|nr:hypothetical protein [Clostridia bacterium]